jgi:HAD superfamily hydrolase (TIGR01490 family)
MAEIIAVFDLEGTLCQGGRLIWRKLIKSCSQRPGGKVTAAGHILHQIMVSYLLKLRLIKEYKSRPMSIKSMAFLLQGFTLEEMSQLAKAISQIVIDTLRTDVASILNNHKDRGHRVILVSNLFQPFLESVGQRLGIKTTLGTGLEVKNSRYTGQLSTPICFDEQRASMLKESFRQNNLKVDFSQSYAYGDLKWDRPVLEMVGNPVAVYPDEVLRAYAQSRGWKIIDSKP